MTAISIEQVKALREKTGISVAQCQKALTEAGGDEAKALEILRTKSADAAAKKADRTLAAGSVATYLHSNGSIGAMVLLASETDFVSNNEEFKTLARDIAMQVSATNPETKDALMAEQFIKNPDFTIGQLVEGAIQKFGEKIEIAQFVRYSATQ